MGEAKSACLWLNTALLFVTLIAVECAGQADDLKLARRVQLLLLAASMFPNAERDFLGDMFTAVLCGCGLFLWERGRLWGGY